jgi:APA family basic amino acid/polyamine antiporter
LCIDLLVMKPQYTWPGLVIVALGVPVYYIWRAIGGRRDADAVAERSAS